MASTSRALDRRTVLDDEIDGGHAPSRLTGKLAKQVGRRTKGWVCDDPEGLARPAKVLEVDTDDADARDRVEPVSEPANEPRVVLDGDDRAGVTGQCCSQPAVAGTEVDDEVITADLSRRDELTSQPVSAEEVLTTGTGPPGPVLGHGTPRPSPSVSSSRCAHEATQAPGRGGRNRICSPQRAKT
jgi:hypothetical protein